MEEITYAGEMHVRVVRLSLEKIWKAEYLSFIREKERQGKKIFFGYCQPHLTKYIGKR